MLRIPGGHRTRTSHRGAPDPGRLRLLALVSVVAAAVALPWAVASAGQVGDSPGLAEKNGRGTAGVKPSAAPPSGARPSGSPLLLGLGLATAARCGPALSSPDGVEAQTCVMAQGEDTWARTYYRNATGEAVDAVLSLMGAGGRTVQIHCPAGTDDEPATCETPRGHTRGPMDAYTAVAEFSRHGGGPLLLHSGSNSAQEQGS
ncbi:hypothetical protein [Streptomyces bungoensis]|uniref:hypothetical protein n=1 Tax=Streptomyces bungoensis TaxID=285568 RepID=UPI000B3273DD|nr:hypothetical protein [Streptomyces bungoensis]